MKREELIEKDYKDAYREAMDLAKALWEKYYKDSAPDWEALGDVAGIITQIDNMAAGIPDLCQPQWVSVEKELPEEYKSVLVWRKGIPVEHTPLGWVVNGKWSLCDVMKPIVVDMWHELPQPPIESKEEL